MTKDEYYGNIILIGNDAVTQSKFEHATFPYKIASVELLWDKINARQQAPFVPDWSLKPEWAVGFCGAWTESGWGRPYVRGEFYFPAPKPTDAELSAMFDKLDKDKRVQILRDAGVVV